MRVDWATENTLLVQVLPTGQGGVFDYAHCLKAAWDAQGVPSGLITLSKDLACERSLADRLRDHAPEALAHCAVVLHFSGYGYGRRGVCFWLLEELRALRARRHAGLTLVVVFHELFASGPPWRSAFWLSRVQAIIASQLAGMADALWTNAESQGDWLRSVVGSHKPVVVRPVFSNIGEPESPPAVLGRRPNAVVFGSPSTRERVFAKLDAHEPTLLGLGIEELIEVGNGSPSKSGLSSIHRRHAGRLEAFELGQLLQQSRFGLLDYPSHLLGKSGVFAAYSAHGCVVLDTCRPGPDTDGLVAGTDYMSLHATAPASAAPDTQSRMATRLMNWYAPHSLAGQARDLLGLAIASSPARQPRISS